MDKEAYAQLRTMEQLGYIVAVVRITPPRHSERITLILLVKKMLCSKLHSQKGFDFILFLYKFSTAFATAALATKCCLPTGSRPGGNPGANE